MTIHHPKTLLPADTEPEQRYYRAVALELAVKTYEGQLNSLSPDNKAREIVRQASEYFHYIMGD